VLLAMADWAMDGDRCFASYRRLAAKARVSVSTVMRALRELEELGEIRQLAPGDFGTHAERKHASDWVLPKVSCVHSDHVFRENTCHVFRENTSCVQREHSTIVNYSIPSSTTTEEKTKTTAIPFSNKSLNQPLLPNGKEKVPPRESVLGKGMSDDDWLDHLATLPQYRGVNVRAKFDHLLKWCADKGETPTRQRLKVWLDKDAKQQRMAPHAPKIVKIVRDDFSELMQELAV
jgi:DNA-binding transcriptional MocR family regulator